MRIGALDINMGYTDKNKMPCCKLLLWPTSWPCSWLLPSSCPGTLTSCLKCIWLFTCAYYSAFWRMHLFQEPVALVYEHIWICVKNIYVYMCVCGYGFHLRHIFYTLQRWMRLATIRLWFGRIFAEPLCYVFKKCCFCILVKQAYQYFDVDVILFCTVSEWWDKVD